MVNQFAEEDNLIRAASFLPSKEELKKQQENAVSAADPLSALLYSDDRDTILYGIFGDLPDYSNPDMEALWDEVLEADPEVILNTASEKELICFRMTDAPLHRGGISPLC